MDGHWFLLIFITKTVTDCIEKIDEGTENRKQFTKNRTNEKERQKWAEI